MGKIPKRNLQVGAGGHCMDGSWGQVPLGCSAQSGGDWAAHYKTDTDNGNACIHPWYQLLCKSSGTVYFCDLVQQKFLYINNNPIRKIVKLMLI